MITPGPKTAPMWPVSPVLTLAARHPECRCTWVPVPPSGPGGMYALKYLDAACPAARFHRELAGGAS
jgi:hypothetical protein